jgi:hypothetical protein
VDAGTSSRRPRERTPLAQPTSHARRELWSVRAARPTEQRVNLAVESLHSGLLGAGGHDMSAFPGRTRMARTRMARARHDKRSRRSEEGWKEEQASHPSFFAFPLMS